MDRTETLAVDPDTGGMKGEKLAKFGQIPPGALIALAEHFGKGAIKYDALNYMQGYDWSLSFDALNRHLWLWWGGEEVDPETGSHHLTAVAWHAMVLFTFATEGLGTDPRWASRGRPSTALIGPDLDQLLAPRVPLTPEQQEELRAEFARRAAEGAVPTL